MANFEPYDYIVVGLGGHGSATLAQLAEAFPDNKILGIEQFTIAHGFGSSHGRSRIYRQAYFEHPQYVPLLQRSLALWKDLQNYYSREVEKNADFDSDKFCGPLLNLCGGMMIGHPSSEVVSGTLRSIEEHKLPHRLLSSQEVKTEFPVFALGEEEIGVWEENAGYLNPELCIETYLQIAKQFHAEIHFEEKLLSIEEDGDNDTDDFVTINTSKGIYRTKKLILTVGAWAPEIYGAAISTTVPLHIERRVLYWFKPNTVIPEQLEYFQNMPIYIWDMQPYGNFYGFPEQAPYEKMIKIALHFPGNSTLPTISNSVDIKEYLKCDGPQSINRNVHDDEVLFMRELFKQKMPLLDGELLHTETCMYTMTPDEHFLIDFHPKFSNGKVIIASPCSGHGFKFCSVIGEVLKDLASTGQTIHDISLFSLKSRSVS